MQIISSALVATQVDAGSAAGVPDLLAQLRMATDQGQLQVSLAHISGENIFVMPAGKTVHGGHLLMPVRGSWHRVSVPVAEFLNFLPCLSWNAATRLDVRNDPQGALQSQGLQVSRVELQAATAVTPTAAASSGSALSVPFIVGIIVVGAVVLLCLFGAAYFGLFRCCMPNNSKKAAKAEQKGAASRTGGGQNDVKPFFEVPKFQQTYPRPPSLVSQSNPAFNPGRPPRPPTRQ